MASQRVLTPATAFTLPSGVGAPPPSHRHAAPPLLLNFHAEHLALAWGTGSSVPSGRPSGGGALGEQQVAASMLRAHLQDGTPGPVSTGHHGSRRWLPLPLRLPPNVFLLPWGQGTVFMSACQQDPWTPAPTPQGPRQTARSLAASLPGSQSLGPSCRAAVRIPGAPAARRPAWPSGTWAPSSAPLSSSPSSSTGSR